MSTDFSTPQFEEKYAELPSLPLQQQSKPIVQQSPNKPRKKSVNDSRMSVNPGNTVPFILRKTEK